MSDNDKSGIHSLGGFSFQIRVFAYYALKLEDGAQVGFEVLDDVSLENYKAVSIDKHENDYKSLIFNNKTLSAIQVKRTKLTYDVAQKVLLNWILLELSDPRISKYILFTVNKYRNNDLIFKKNSEQLFNIIMDADDSNKSLIGKVKSSFNNDFDKFNDIFVSIQNKYEFKSIDDIDKLIEDAGKILFHKNAYDYVTYSRRIKEFLQHVTYEVIDAVNNKIPYVMSEVNLMSCVDDICLRITDKEYLPNYAEFKKTNSINFNDLKIASSREYIQLTYCGLPKNIIEQHLIYSSYYKNLRYSFLETSKKNIIQNIEETAFENFQNIKYDLEMSNQDKPYNRLVRFKQASNSYALDDQIRYGTGVYLTREKEKDRQVSWKDDENE